MKYQELKKLFCTHESSNPKNHLTAYLTFSSFGPEHDKAYPWESRTYVISSDNKAFQAGMGGYSIFGCCLDGTDRCLCLDGLMVDEHGGKDGWVIEDCCILADVLMEHSDSHISPPVVLYSLAEAQNHMLCQLAEKGGLNLDRLKKCYSEKKWVHKNGCYGASENASWLTIQKECWRWEIKPAYIYSALQIEIDDE